MKNSVLKFATFVVCFFFFQDINAQETHLMIRAKAKDAKFIGSSIGGAKILVKNSLSGEILSEGITKGSTGNTDKIMKQDWKRKEDLSDENTAGFEAILDIKEPLFVTIEAYAPFNKKQSRVMSSTQLWLIPGKDILGDGVVLEIPGFTVDIISPQTHEGISENTEVEIKANVVMMCGCPVTENGIWDATQYEIKALITNAEGKSFELELNVTDKASTFSAKTKLTKGLYEVLIYAFDPVSGNTGVDKTNFIVN